ncbi:MAG: undecaprenyl/decaprenyl-phosphate alpha-N-acetylglucosaminyl 1-phosphate transferase [Pirellulales bacterium]|nr:undecaprenyl/decaprenyl-phosphate alpha-N-acetylglucosaminyl 1-phosphate transferase [Pirellulales bacterium]
MTLITLAAIGLVTYLVASVLSTVIASLASRVGFVDRPDGNRKIHKNPTPLGGGLALFLTVAIAIVLLRVVPNPWQQKLVEAGLWLWPWLAGGGAILFLGTIDDRWALRAWQKLAGQLMVASCLVAFLPMVQSLELLGYRVELGVLALPVTLLWLAVTTNSMNLLDGIDGAAAVVGLILAATVAAVAVVHGHVIVALVGVLFAASLYGFLRHNFPPARIFLGDGGAMLIGLLLGALTLLASHQESGTVAVIGPLAIWTVPLLDTTIAVCRRAFGGRGIFKPDRDHLPHRLMALFSCNRHALGWLAAFCLAPSIAAILGALLMSDVVGILGALGLVGFLVSTRMFGHAELLAATRRLKSLGQSLFQTPPGTIVDAGQEGTPALNAGQWGSIWSALLGSAVRFDWSEVSLAEKTPIRRKGYRAAWTSSQSTTGDPRWRVDLPVMVAGHVVGHVTVTSTRNRNEASRDIQALLGLLASFETQSLEAAETLAPVCLQRE